MYAKRLQMLQALSSSTGIKVILTTDVPPFRKNPAECAMHDCSFTDSDWSTYSTFKAAFEEAAGGTLVYKLDMKPAFCSSSQCDFFIPGTKKAAYSDYMAHLTDDGQEVAANVIVQFMQQNSLG